MPMKPINLSVPSGKPDNNLPAVKQPNVPIPVTPSVPAPNLPNGGITPQLPIQSTPIPIGGNQSSVELPKKPLPVSSKRRVTVHIPISGENVPPASDTFEAKIPQTQKKNVKAPTIKEITKMFKGFETIDNDEMKTYIEAFKKLSPELQRELVDNPVVTAQNGEEIGNFPASALLQDNAETLIRNFKAIAKGIDLSKFRGSEFYDYNYYSYLSNPKVLSQNPKLITDLINSRKSFELELFKRGFTEKEYNAFSKKGIFAPELLEAFNRIPLNRISIDDLRAFLKLDKSMIEDCFRFISPKNLGSFISGNSKNLKSYLNPILSSIKRMLGEITPKKLIITKILMSSPQNLKDNASNITKLFKFYETHYSDEINAILADPNVNLLALNPTRYNIPQISYISGNMALIEKKLGGLPIPGCELKTITYVNLATGEKMYSINKWGHVELNNGNIIKKYKNKLNLQSSNSTIETIQIDDTGFANIDSNDGSKSSRTVLEDGTEKQSIKMKSKDGFECLRDTVISPDKSSISSELVLRDKEGAKIFGGITQIQQNADGNTVTVTINGKTETFTSQIKDDKVILTHNGKTTEATLKDFAIYNSETNLPFISIYAATAALENEEFFEDFWMSNPSYSEKQIDKFRDLTNKTIENFKTFLSRVKADDLLALLKNGQKLDLNQFGYDNKGERYFSSEHYFDSKEFRIVVDPNNPSTITNMHEFGHALDWIQKTNKIEALQKIFQEELANVSPEAQYYLDYFLSASAADCGGLREFIAEMYAFMYATEMKNTNYKEIAYRGQILMREFPRTGAEIMKIFAEYKAGL